VVGNPFGTVGGEVLMDEGRICEIFAEVLLLDSVRPDDDFFELGGHSLRAGKVAARIRSESGVRIRLSEFLERPTARHVASMVRAARDGAAS
jgi:hypothetical protein